MITSQFEKHYKREVYLSCQGKGHLLLKQGVEFAINKSADVYKKFFFGREEVAINARYMHRGYYCPSPVREIIIGNAQRGKILSRITNKSRISHRYFFDVDDRLYISQSMLPNGTMKTEYLIYSENCIRGYAFDSWGTLVGISEECYTRNKLESYFCASCYNNREENVDFGITEIYYEIYHYDNSGLQDVEFYHIIPYPADLVSENDDFSDLVKGNRYRFVRENGYLTGFYSIQLDGEEQCDKPLVTEIAVKKRKLA